MVAWPATSTNQAPPRSGRGGQPAQGPSRSSNKSQSQSQSQSQNQKQQSGETLSSFESDYDLLLYLGETETEDIVETERSLDYQDQTWRQSICGGASLAPTIDESLSELLSATSNNLGASTPTGGRPGSFELLNSPSPTTWSVPRTQRQPPTGGLSNTLNSSPSAQAKRPSPIARNQQQVAGNRSPVSHRSAVGRVIAPQVGHSNFELAHHSLDDEVRDAFERAEPNLGADWRRRQEHQHQTQGLGTRIASLFNRRPNQQQQVAPIPMQPDKFGAAQQVRNRPAEEMRRPEAGQSEAAELDRLLAEMNQSLDLDSLARYDPYPGRPLPAQKPPGRGLPAARQQQHIANSKPPASSEQSILDEYNGASRILEQMISEQLAGQQAPAIARSVVMSQTLPQGCKLQAEQLATERSQLASSRPLNEAESRPVKTGARRVSTASSSVATTTEASVVPNARYQRQIPIEVEPPAQANRKELYEKRSVWRYKGSSIKGSRGEQVAANSSAKREPEELRRDQPAPSQPDARRPNRRPGPPSHWSRSLEVVEPAPADRQTSSSPPPPPEVDYSDDERDVIEAAPAEPPAGTSDEDNDDNGRATGRGRGRKGLPSMGKMKRRTLLSMRSMRNQLSDLLGTQQQEKARSQRGPTTGGRPAKAQAAQRQPQPPERSSSIGGSSQRLHEISGSLKEPSPISRRRVETTAAAQVRQSRGRERRQPPPPPTTATGGAKSLGQQLRERLSKSKSRLKEFLTPGAALRRAQSTPDERRHEQGPTGNRLEAPLCQPSDIARNSGDDFDASLDRHLAAKLSLEPKRTGRPSASSGSLSSQLSGLDRSSKSRNKLAGGRSRSKESMARRSSSLASIKRLSNPFRGGRGGDGHEVEDLDSMKVPAKGSTSAGMRGQLVRAERRRKRKRGRNRSAGGSRSKSTSPPTELAARKLSTTDDYFGQVNPAKAPEERPSSGSSVHLRIEMGPKVRPATEAAPDRLGDAKRAKRRPNRSQSLRSASRTIAVRPNSKAESGETKKTEKQQQQRSVSFSNLTGSQSPVNQRRPLNSSANSFRPTSANAKLDLPLGSSLAPPEALDRRSVTPTSLGTKVTTAETMSTTTTTTSSTNRVQTPGARSPIRERGAALMGDFRAKCAELFKGRQLKPATPVRKAPTPPWAPTRPPRRRRKTGRGEGDESDEDPTDGAGSLRAKSLAARPTVEPQSSSSGSEPEVAPAGGGRLTVAQPSSPVLERKSAARASKRLFEMASQLKHSTADFFQSAPEANDSRRAHHQTTVVRRALIRNLEEPTNNEDLCQWRPVIQPTSSGRPSRSGSSRARAKGKLRLL